MKRYLTACVCVCMGEQQQQQKTSEWLPWIVAREICVNNIRRQIHCTAAQNKHGKLTRGERGERKSNKYAYILFRIYMKLCKQSQSAEIICVRGKCAAEGIFSGKWKFHQNRYSILLRWPNWKHSQHCIAHKLYRIILCTLPHQSISYKVLGIHFKHSSGVPSFL